MARPAWPAPITIAVVRFTDVRDRSDRARRRTSVGLVMMSNTAERFCDWATSASISSRVASASMAKRTGDRVEAVADVGIGAEDAEHVHVALDRRRDRTELDAAVLGDGGDAGGEAADEADEHVLDRGGAEVLRGEALGVVDVEVVRRCGADARCRGRRSRSRWSGCACPAATCSWRAT